MMKLGRAGSMRSRATGEREGAVVGERSPSATLAQTVFSSAFVSVLITLGTLITAGAGLAFETADTPLASPVEPTIPTALATPAPPASPALPGVSSAPPLSDSSLLWGSETVSVEEFDYTGLPGRLSDDELRELWREGLTHERAERLIEASEYYERIVAQVPEESFTYWRLARNYWRAGESLPIEAAEERLSYFKRAERWAARGIAADDECAPCMLWQFVSMGRQATTEGVWTAARYAKDMARLLERGISLEPDYQDMPGNSVLGNLYYSGAVFYRFVPDSWWLKLLIGVRGDLDRSLTFIRKAVDLSEQRVDYRVELGAVLLCRGAKKKHRDSIEEGIAVLLEAQGLPAYLSTDHLDLEHAVTLIEKPDLACGYSRDGFIDLDEVVERAKVSSR